MVGQRLNKSPFCYFTSLIKLPDSLRLLEGEMASNLILGRKYNAHILSTLSLCLGHHYGNYNCTDFSGKKPTSVPSLQQDFWDYCDAEMIVKVKYCSCFRSWPEKL